MAPLEMCFDFQAVFMFRQNHFYPRNALRARAKQNLAMIRRAMRIGETKLAPSRQWPGDDALVITKVIRPGYVLAMFQGRCSEVLKMRFVFQVFFHVSVIYPYLVVDSITCASTLGIPLVILNCDKCRCK